MTPDSSTYGSHVRASSDNIISRLLSYAAAHQLVLRVLGLEREGGLLLRRYNLQPALHLTNYNSLTALPDLTALSSLQELCLDRCSSLTALPDLTALSSLQSLFLLNCRSLTAEVVVAAEQQVPAGAKVYS